MKARNDIERVFRLAHVRAGGLAGLHGVGADAGARAALGRREIFSTTRASRRASGCTQVPSHDDHAQCSKRLVIAAGAVVCLGSHQDIAPASRADHNRRQVQWLASSRLTNRGKRPRWGKYRCDRGIG
jgi:hypothetical protein